MDAEKDFKQAKNVLLKSFGGIKSVELWYVKQCMHKLDPND